MEQQPLTPTITTNSEQRNVIKRKLKKLKISLRKVAVNLPVTLSMTLRKRRRKLKVMKERVKGNTRRRGHILPLPSLKVKMHLSPVRSSTKPKSLTRESVTQLELRLLGTVVRNLSSSSRKAELRPLN
jgi:hypothetical protein